MATNPAVITHLRQDYDATLGLWRRTGAGHTLEVAKLTAVHEGRVAAGRLVSAAQLGLLGELPPGPTLRSLRAMQDLSGGPRHGCFRWYWEEPAIRDTNAGFFIGMQLLVLERAYGAALAPDDRALLQSILRDLQVWFGHAVAERLFRYLNKYLGDLVCAWLLSEVNDDAAFGARVATAMAEAAEYWRTQHWGWGEHLSDIYAGVALDQLGVLLLLARRLPADLRGSYHCLLQALLRIEDQFGGQPRVPALRSYAFTEAAKHLPYRASVKTWAPPADGAAPTLPNLRNLLARWDWTALAGPPTPAETHPRVPCINGAVAMASRYPDAQVGAMSQFPLMPDIDHQTWGLSWQCFPLAFWRPGGDWGFLQWQSKVGERQRAHPALEKSAAYLGNALIEALEPPVVGQFWAREQDGELVILRAMPQLPAAWDVLVDRFRLLGGQCTPANLTDPRGHAPLILRYPERTVSLLIVPLTHTGTPRLAARGAGEWDYEIRFPAPSTLGPAPLVTAWGMSLHGILERPTLRLIAPGEWSLDWRMPRQHWRLRLSASTGLHDLA